MNTGRPFWGESDQRGFSKSFRSIDSPISR
ncbi:MAG: hypothetical protein H6Q09_349 [Acidobacteria bacterium]|nr:hypothetical protein [Acidobacteriota bacterium]